MAPHIGSVYLTYPLAWQNKPIASLNAGKMGSDTRTITGDMVFLRGKVLTAAVPVEATFLFDWETAATVAALDALWKAGQPIYCDFEGTGDSYQFMFAAEDGLTDPSSVAFGEKAIHSAIAGADHNDTYKGKIHGYILSGL
jgi:hypothetical protein